MSVTAVPRKRASRALTAVGDFVVVALLAATVVAAALVVIGPTPLVSDVASDRDGAAAVEPADAQKAAPVVTDETDGAGEAAAVADDAAAYDHEAEVDAAIEILTVNDNGTRYDTAGRWRQDTVTVTVEGDQVTDDGLAEIDEVLVWMSDATGLLFVRIDQGDGDIDVTMASDKLPRARQRLTGDTIVSASAAWNASYEPYRVRWMWEELVHTTGPVGDYGPAATLFNGDMAAPQASDFDRWLVEGLYAAEGTSPTQLRAWYEANPRQ